MVVEFSTYHSDESLIAGYHLATFCEICHHLISSDREPALGKA
jgi:hypothetical protein